MNNQAYDDTATRNPRKAYTDYENSTYTVVSKVAYLIGVQKRIFENEYEPPKMEWYEKLHADKNARIVRNLCMIRTALELNFKAINNRMRFDMCNLHSLPEYVPQDSLNELLQDGITIVRSRALPAEYIVDINKHISNRINNCKSLFPLWLKWEYVRKLFLMPDGLNKKGIKAAAADYYANKNKYPYQVYINWSYMDSGNILYNDKKFVSLLYEANEDYFTDLSKVSDAGNLTKAGIYKFLDKSERVVVVVDCENSDPYKLYATLNNLNAARKKDICWDLMKQLTVEEVEKGYQKCVAAFASNDPTGFGPLTKIVEDGIASWGSMIYLKGETLDEFKARKGATDMDQYMISSFAAIDRNGDWLGSGDMGWFGISTNDKEERAWNDELQTLMNEAQDDDFLVVVDCHI